MSLRRALALLLLSSLGACAGGNYRTDRPAGVDPAPSGPTRPAVPRFTQRSRVSVLLAAAEGRAEIELEDDGHRVRFARAGELVLSSEAEAAEELAFSPTAADSVAYEGRVYPGRLRVLARPGGGLRLLNDVDLESYVEGVVAAELSLWSALPAELEAQAVAVRTYALHSLGRRLFERGPDHAFLWDSVEDQAYRGRWVPAAGNEGEQRAARRLRDAVAATRGLVLVRPDGELYDARFHAACGGRTALLEEIFPDAEGPGRGVDCAPCAGRAALERGDGPTDGARPIRWEHTFPPEELAALARDAGVGDRLTTLAPSVVDASGRWLEVQVAGARGTAHLGVDAVRRRLGFQNLKSARIESTWPAPGLPIENGLFVSGTGRGHGVGLCQEGTRDYARQGWNARRILEHYYPAARLVELPMD